jgi:small subunit ribosomal protein S17
MAEPVVARGSRKVREGTVVSDKMQKTVVVEVQSQKPHALYKKVVRYAKKIKVHDESGEAHLGDRVRITETRPISKEVHWRLLEVVEKAK